MKPDAEMLPFALDQQRHTCHEGCKRLRISSCSPFPAGSNTLGPLVCNPLSRSRLALVVPVVSEDLQPRVIAIIGQDRHLDGDLKLKAPISNPGPVPNT